MFVDTQGTKHLVSRTVCALLASVLPLAAFVPDTAHAADVLPVSGLAEVLPAPALTGDGRTQAELHMVLRTASGAPILGAKLRGTASSGQVADVVELSDGLYRIRYTPPEVASKTSVTITVKGRTTELGPVEASRAFDVMPAPDGRIGIALGAPAMVLGQDAETSVSFTLPTRGGAMPSVDDLIVRVTSGQVTKAVSVGGGRFAARFVPPSVNYPHLAVITVVDRRNPSRVWGTAAIALQGKVDYPVSAPAGSNVVLRLGDRDFGPVTADASGRASVPIIVPPGMHEATQIVAQGSNVTESVLDLRVPEAGRVGLFELPTSVPSDARVGVPVLLAVYEPSGAPDLDAEVLMSATAGRVSDARHAGGGVYLATYTPPDGRTEMAATIQANVTGTAALGDDAEITLIPAMPASLVLTPEPGELAPGGTGLKVFASLAGSDGAGLPGRALRFRAAGATQKGTVVDLKGGDYRADFSAEGNTDVLVRTIALSSPSRNALDQVVLLPSFGAVPPGGSAIVTVVTTDAFGYAVPHMAVNLVATGGEVPATVTTDASGIAEVVYVGDDTPGLATIQATSGQASGAVSFFRADLDPGVFLPASGTLASRTAATAWRAAQGAVYVEREGGLDAPIGVIDLPVAAASAGGIAVAAEPSVVAPGGSVSLDMRVTDDNGMGVDGSDIEIFATGGARVQAVESLGDGQYRAVVFVPTDAADTIKLNVVVDGGTASSVIEVPVSADAVMVTDGPVPDEVVDTAPVATVDRPNLRVRASFLLSTYTYEQSPGVQSGTLLPTALGWGGERGGAPTPLGVEANLRGFLPMFRYLGLDANFRYSRYDVESASFSEPAVDNLFALRADLVARAPIAVKANEVSIGARVGFRYDDFITFRGCTDPGCVVSYEPLAVPGLNTGLELGAEFWHMYLIAKGDVGFGYGTAFYAANADLNLGWNITRHVLIDLGFGYQWRNASMEGADSGILRGELSDQQIMGTVGAGFSF